MMDIQFDQKVLEEILADDDSNTNDDDLLSVDDILDAPDDDEDLLIGKSSVNLKKPQPQTPTTRTRSGVRGPEKPSIEEKTAPSVASANGQHGKSSAELDSVTEELNQLGVYKQADDFPLLFSLDASKTQPELQTILLPKPLRKLSQTITSEGMRREAGFPTCVAVSKKCIAVGTAHGLVLLFDHTQELKRILGAATDAEYGPITAIDISTGEEAFLICGHQDGHIVLWDMIGGVSLKSAGDHHQTAIIHLKFIDDSHQIVSADLQGRVFKFAFTNSWWGGWTVEGVMILNGKAGQVLALTTLLPPSINQESLGPLHSSTLLAISIPRQTTILRISPQVDILLKLPAGSGIPQGSLPYLCWQPIAMRKSSQGQLQLSNPLLAIGWGKTISLVEVTTSRQGLQFVNRGRLETDTEIAGMEWLDQSVIALLNKKDQLRVIEALSPSLKPSGEQLESRDIKTVGLVYHTRFGAGICAYHNAVVQHNSKLYLLGVDSIYSAHVLSWDERITFLVDDDKWLSALSLALEFYEGKAKAVAGLPPRPEIRKRVLSDKIVELLISYMHMCLRPPDLRKGKKDQEAAAAARLVGSVCIEYLVHLKRTDVLFRDVWQMFNERQHVETFLRLLEPAILMDKLNFVVPEIMQAFVSYYAEHKMMHRIEQCILHLDIGSMDFHQVVTLCREHYLSSGLIYVYNKGLDDYVTPLDHLMTVLLGAKDDIDAPESSPSGLASHRGAGPLETRARMTNSKSGLDRRNLGYKVLVYLSYCLQGKAYPKGIIPKTRMAALKSEIYHYLFQADTPEAENYSRLSCLLHLDTKETLNVISAAFEDHSYVPDKMPPPTPPDLQQMLIVLESIILFPMKDPSKSEPPPKGWAFTPLEMGHFLQFLAKYVATGRILAHGGLMLRMIHYLCHSPDPTSATERQRLMYNIIVAHPYLLTSDLLLDVETASPEPFYAVAELYYRKTNDYKHIIGCYLKDKTRKGQVFQVIKDLLTQGREAAAVVEKATVEVLTTLMGIDAQATSELILSSFTHHHATLLEQLQNHPQQLFNYLHAIMSSQRKPGGGEAEKSGGLCLTPKLHEKYFGLMCKYSPEAVLEYLQSSDSLVSLDQCLSLCKSHHLTDATVYLLERTGDVSGALDLLLRHLESKLLDLAKSYGDDPYTLPPQSESLPAENAVQEALQSAIALCQRNSPRLDEKENEALWFRLLDTLVLPLRKLKSKKNRIGLVQKPYRGPLQTNEDLVPPAIQKQKQHLTQQIRNVLYNMMGHVGLTAILGRITAEHGSDDFGDFKGIIQGMLDSYSHERRMLENVNAVLEGDIFRSLKELHARRQRGTRPKHELCCLCRNPFSDPAFLLADRHVGIALFACGHAFHGSCIARFRLCPLCHRADARRPSTTPNIPSGLADELNALTTRPHAATIGQHQAQNSNPEVLKDYLGRLDKFTNRDEASKLDLLYNLTGKRRPNKRGARILGGSPVPQQREAGVYSAPVPTSVNPAQGKASKRWRTGVRLSQQDLQKQGFRLSMRNKPGGSGQNELTEL